jgi:hypothetical protein
MIRRELVLEAGLKTSLAWLSLVAGTLGGCASADQDAGEGPPEVGPNAGAAAGPSAIVAGETPELAGQPEPADAASPSGVSERAVPELDRVEAARDERHVTADAWREPRGVVLANGRVISEEEAASGLTPKAGVHQIFRVEGTTFGNSLAMLPMSTHFCTLTLVWGALYDTVGGAGVMGEGPTWKVNARRPSVNVSHDKAAAEGTCYPHSAFIANNAVTWMSNSIPVAVSGTGESSADLWWGDAASTLTGIFGKFFGSGERGWVEQSLASDFPSKIRMKTQQGGVHTAAGSSYFVGTPGGTHEPQFIGPNGAGDAGDAGEYEFTYDGREDFSLPPAGPKFRAGSLKMASVDEAMCYLTSVSGRFNGGDEWVQIWPEADGFFRLQARAKVGTEGRVTARARCLRFRQTAGQ